MKRVPAILGLLLLICIAWGVRKFRPWVCEVHKTKMEHNEVPIAYGLILPGPDAPSADTERQSFPHQREYSLGGCTVTPDSPKTKRVYVCTDCKKAYGKWMTGNKKAR